MAIVEHAPALSNIPRKETQAEPLTSAQPVIDADRKALGLLEEQVKSSPKALSSRSSEILAKLEKFYGAQPGEFSRLEIKAGGDQRRELVVLDQNNLVVGNFLVGSSSTNASSSVVVQSPSDGLAISRSVGAQLSNVAEKWRYEFDPGKPGVVGNIIGAVRDGLQTLRPGNVETDVMVALGLSGDKGFGVNDIRVGSPVEVTKFGKLFHRFSVSFEEGRKPRIEFTEIGKP